jgi:DNA polymerase-3 subunit delta'
MSPSWQAAPYPWQQSQWQQLTRQIIQQHPPQALLLTGPRGLGKQHFAQAFSAWLLCDQALQNKQQACGQCRSCRLIQAASHPGLLLLEPTSTSRSIKIEAIRAVTAFINQTSQQPGYKVVLINGLETTTLAATNALLKGLEEPPANTLFILVNERLGALLPTLISRCQRLPFKAQLAQSQAWLVEQGIDSQQAAILLNLCPQPLQALAVANNQCLAHWAALWSELEQLIQGKLDLVSFTEKCLQQSLNDFFDGLMLALQAAIKVQLTANSQYLIDEHLAQLYRQVLGRQPIKLLFDLLADVQQRQQLHFSQLNANPELMLSGLFSRWLSLLLKPGK